jgi:SP family general alpha glucoside:H+ symporter-like MFS transporter
MLGQFFVGLSGAIEQLTVTPYAVEIAPTRIRGGVVTFQAVWSVFGLFSSFFLLFLPVLTSYRSSIFGIVFNVMLETLNKRFPFNWRVPLYVIWPMALVILAAIITIPESPWFYARRGNKEAACRSLTKLYGNIPGYNVEEEYGIIERTLAHERHVLEIGEGTESWLDLFRKGNLKRTLIVSALEAGILLGGLSMVGNFSTYFFSIAGEDNPFLANLIVA